MKGIFVTGTDTGVGKTVASALITLAALSKFGDVSYIKPIQTGSPPDDDAARVFELIGGRASCYSGLQFTRPLSPHLAAHYDHAHINFHNVVRNFNNFRHGFSIVEGAGGLLVPLNQRFFIIDVIDALRMPCVLVAANKLGTINHSLLSLEALRRRQIRVHGVLLVGDKNRDNAQAIANFGRIDNVVMLPHFSDVCHETLAAQTSLLKNFFTGLL